jgi:type I restriction enzyme S subunit
LVESELAGVWGEEADDGANDIVCVRVADFDRRKARVTTEKLTTRSVPPDQRLKRELRRGDVLLERSGGGDNQPVGYAVLFDHVFEAVCSNFVSRLRVVSNADPRFVTYVLGAAYSGRINVKSIKQTTGIQNLDYRRYMNERWVFPDLKEQDAIANYLDSQTAKIDVVCDKLGQQLDKLAEYRQALITAAVTGQIAVTAETLEPEEAIA